MDRKPLEEKEKEERWDESQSQLSHVSFFDDATIVHAGWYEMMVLLFCSRPTFSLSQLDVTL